MSAGDDGVANVIARLTVVPFLILARAYVLASLWTWFLVPLGVMRVGVSHAYGVSIIASLLVFDGSITRDTDRGLGENISNSLLFSGAFLGFGWIAHYFMGVA